MSNAAESLPPVPPTPEEIAAHFAIYHNPPEGKEKLVWSISKGWLIEHGLIPDDRKKSRKATTFVPTTAIGPPSFNLVRTVARKEPPKRFAVWEKMSEVKEEKQEWLWRDRLALKTMSLMVGEPGQGKSSLALAIAARITTGEAMPCTPDEPRHKGSVIILQNEMRWGVHVRSRLQAEGADLDRIHILRTVMEEDSRATFSLARDLPILEEKVKSVGDVKFIIIDPISSHVDGIDENKSSDVRSITDPLFEFAEKHGLTILIIAHLNKSNSPNILSRIAGSLAYGASARMVWYVSQHPGDSKKQMMSYVKGNETDFKPPALSYAWSEGTHVFDPKPVDLVANDVARLLADNLASGRETREKWNATRGPVPAKQEEAANAILKLLTTGPMLLTALKEMAINQGVIKAGVFRKAFEKLVEQGRVEKFYPEGMNRYWARLGTGEQTPMPLFDDPDDGGEDEDETED